VTSYYVAVVLDLPRESESRFTTHLNPDSLIEYPPTQLVYVAEPVSSVQFGDLVEQFVRLVRREAEVFDVLGARSMFLEAVVTELGLDRVGAKQRVRHERTRQPTTALAPVGTSLAISLLVCLSVCPPAYLENHMADYRHFRTQPTSWLGLSLTALQCVMYFRFCR